MFNGIIFNKGIINRVKKRAKGVNLFIKSSLKVSNKNLGISISCDGVCLTLISYKNKTLEFYLSNETLAKSKFRNIEIGDEITFGNSKGNVVATGTDISLIIISNADAETLLAEAPNGDAIELIPIELALNQ